MEDDAIWIANANNDAFGGGNLSARLRDFGRIGLFMLNNGAATNKQLLPPTWVAQSSTPAKASLQASDRYNIDFHGYGYQRWISGNGAYEARGVFAQTIHIDPKNNMII